MANKPAPSLPEEINPADCVAEGVRANHWLHQPTGIVFSQFPGWPDAAPPKSRDLYQNEAMPLAAAPSKYVVVLPNGKKVTCADEASADALLDAMGVTPSASTVKPVSGPTPEEIAAHKAQIAAEEAAEQAELDEARKKLEAQFGLGPEETAQAAAADGACAEAAADPAAKSKGK